MQTVITVTEVLAAAELPVPEQSEKLQAATRGLAAILADLMPTKED